MLRCNRYLGVAQLRNGFKVSVVTTCMNCAWKKKEGAGRMPAINSHKCTGICILAFCKIMSQ